MSLGSGVSSINQNDYINNRFPTPIFKMESKYGKQREMKFPDMSNQLQTYIEFLVNNTRTPDGVKIPQNYVLPNDERQGIIANPYVKDNPLLKGFPKPESDKRPGFFPEIPRQNTLQQDHLRKE